MKWRGLLAPLDTVSMDGRVICTPVNGTVRTREYPLPVMLRNPHTSMGHVDRVWIEDGALWGEGALSMGSMGRLPIGIDLDEVSSEHTHDVLRLTDWRLIAVTVYGSSDRAFQAFPEAYIRVVEEV